MRLAPFLSSFPAMLFGCGPPAAPPTSAGPFTIDTVATSATLAMDAPVAAYPVAAGRLAILDYAARRVLILDSSGRLDTTLGRPGRGPGEWELAHQLALRGDTLAVLDIGNGRLCNFVLGTGFVGNRPLPRGFAHQAFVLLPGDTSLHMTDGADGALAILRAPDGTSLARYGQPLASPQAFFDLRSMKRAVAAGRVPDEFRNNVLPVMGPGRDVWLIQQTTGVVEHFAPDGTLLGSLTLPADHVQRRLSEFFRRNREVRQDPARIAALAVVAGAAAQADGLWLLLAGPDTAPARLLAIDTSHVIREQHALAAAAGAASLTPASLPDAFYLVNMGEGVVLRARRARAGV